MNPRLQNRLKGAGTALITPFNTDGSIDFASLGKIIAGNIAAGIDFLCVLGTTAETPTLSPEEQMAVREYVVKVTEGKVPLLLGFGGNDTASMAGKLVKESFEGYDALLVVTPFYNKPNQEGLYRHYRALAEASPKPIILYNVPGRTGVNLLPDTVLRIAADCQNVIGIKEASGNIGQIRTLLASRPDNFTVLSGDDPLTCDIMEAGGDGVISVASNARPAQISGIIHCPETARSTDAGLKPLYKLLFKEGNPTGIKGLLSLEGMCHNIVRLPLAEASDSLLNEMKELL